MSRFFQYDRHDYGEILRDSERFKTSLTWLRNDNLDSWRHQRMRAHLKVIAEYDAAASWLTVGDGRYGTDGQALRRMGADHVHCSDLDDTLLKIAAEKGLISTYSKQNAESLDFEEDAFDYVYCKESFHHFPRPYIALCEMFRVARKAVILTEPRDNQIDRAIFHPVLMVLARFIGKGSEQHNFEPVGNYVYTLSLREMQKFLLGMHYRFIAHHEMNDAYEQGIEFLDIQSKSKPAVAAARRIRWKICFKDLLGKLGLMKPSILSVVLFKEEPDESLLARLAETGWRVRELPESPYR